MILNMLSRSAALASLRHLSAGCRTSVGESQRKGVVRGVVMGSVLVALAAGPVVADQSRPTHAVVEACLANWDRDAEPDGWKARVVLLDKHSRPAPGPAHATFELIPRVPSLDRTRYIDAPVKPLRWWKKLEFDASGVAEVQLPKRVGEPEVSLARQHRETRFGRRPYLDNRVGRGMLGEFAGPEGPPPPHWAVLRVRVSVPTVGVLESVVPVTFAEPLLVDSGWPYR